MKTSLEPPLARWRERLAERWSALVGKQPSPAVLGQVQGAIQRAVDDVHPTAGFRQQLGERLSLAAQSQTVGMSVQRIPNGDRLALLTSAAVIALVVTGLALLIRRLVR